MMSQQVLKPHNPSSLLAPKGQVARVFTGGHRHARVARTLINSSKASKGGSSDENAVLSSGALNAATATLLAASFVAALPVQAVTLEATPGALPTVVGTPTPGGSAVVDQTVGTVIDVVKAAGGAAKKGLDYVGIGLGYAKQAYDKAAPVVKEATDTAAPYVKKGLDVAGEVARPVIRAAEPVVKGGVSEVESFLRGQGLNAGGLANDVKKVSGTASDAYTQAKPTVDSTIFTLSNSSPALLAEYALGALALYYLGPGVIKTVFGSLRGYAGNISAAGALDVVSNDGNTLIIDIRTDREKESGGIPDIPTPGRLVELEYAAISDRKMRGQLRNPGEIEKTVTVLSIAALKKVSKGTRVLLLDRNGAQSKQIAKALAKKGFKKVYVINGGFGGWTSSKLQTKGSSTVSSVEVLAPVFGTQRNRSNTGRTSSSRLSLPGGR